jgi:hypothetical protein
MMDRGEVQNETHVYDLCIANFEVSTFLLDRVCREATSFMMRACAVARTMRHRCS